MYFIDHTNLPEKYFRYCSIVFGLLSKVPGCGLCLFCYTGYIMRQGTKGQSRHACMPVTDLGDRKNMRKSHPICRANHIMMPGSKVFDSGII